MAAAILIADDEMHILLLIEQSIEELEDEGVEILTVNNGEEALDTARRRHPDVILLDVMMPKMNGFEVCEAIRQDASIGDTHIILLTAKGQEYDRRRGEEVGANRYVTKPFDPDELLALVRSALGLDGDTP
jgi:DNA-binding response OmpR family regulator